MQQQLIIIDSKDRSSQSISSSNFQYVMQSYGPYGVFGYRVNKVTIPFSWYTIVDQTFVITFDSVDYTIPVFEGQYNASQLANAIQSALDAVVGSGKLTFIFQTNGTNKYLIQSVNSGDTFILRFDENNLPANMQYKSVGIATGYATPKTLASPSLTPVNVLASPFAVNLSGPPNIYVKSPSLQIYTSSFFNQNADVVIQTIPVNVNPGEVIVWENTYPVGNFQQDPYRSNTIWQFSIVDEYNNVVNLNGLDWSIEIEVFYKFA